LPFDVQVTGSIVSGQAQLPPLLQAPSVSPCAACAASAFSLTVMVTVWLLFAWWQIVMLLKGAANTIPTLSIRTKEPTAANFSDRLVQLPFNVFIS
jgi:hypothetical protein